MGRKNVNEAQGIRKRVKTVAQGARGGGGEQKTGTIPAISIYTRHSSCLHVAQCWYTTRPYDPVMQSSTEGSPLRQLLYFNYAKIFIFYSQLPPKA
jgi:hypothetical protein